MSEVPRTLDAGSASTIIRDGCTSVVGRISNLSVSVNPYRVKISKGSLCKWYLGNNIQSMTLEDTRRAIEKLSDRLRVPMGNAVVTRLDYGLTLPVKESPGCYLNLLGPLRGAERGNYGQSVYYSIEGGREQLCFYDKSEESKSKRVPPLTDISGGNLIRYEQRYLSGDIGARLKLPRLTAGMLYDEAVNRRLAEEWRGVYFSIERLTVEQKQLLEQISIMKLRGRKTINERNEMIAISLYGIEGYLSQIDEAQRCGEMSKWKALRAKKRAIELHEELQSMRGAAPSLIGELDDKISEAAREG